MHRPSFTSHLDLFVASSQRRNPSLNYTRRQTISMVSGYWIDDDFILVYYFPYKVSKNISPVMIHDFFLSENNYFREAETIDLRTSLLSVPTKWLEKLENYGRVDPNYYYYKWICHFYFSGIYIRCFFPIKLSNEKTSVD